MNAPAARIAVVILAAGPSTRMGFPKQLLPFRGKKLVRSAVEAATGAGCGPVIVVVGAYAKPIAAEVSDFDVTVVTNFDWEAGIGSSIAAGVRMAEELDIDGVLLMHTDQPFVSSAILRKFVETQRHLGNTVVASRYAGTVGVPVVFMKTLFGKLHKLGPSQGCKSLIAANMRDAVLITCPEAAIDIDTPGEYHLHEAGEPVGCLVS
jgi:molybdenum cofactor cytidylyltransferase